MAFSSSNRVVVTGMGVVSPCGIGLDAYWDALINCKSGIKPISLFDTAEFSVKTAGEVSNFDLKDFFGRDCKPNRLARQTQLGLVACKMALEHAGISLKLLECNEPVPVVMGVCCSAIDITEKAKEIMMTKGVDRVRPFMVGSSQPHAVSAALSHFFGVQTSVCTLSSACPSGLDSIENAADMIREGKADFVIAGAADSPLNAASLASFIAAGIPPVNMGVPPEKESCPFDCRSAGGPMAEGAGFVVLERLDTALSRGATTYIEILGGATLSDPPGSEPLSGLIDTMQLALKNAGVHPNQLDYICANAISHAQMDVSEVRQIKKLLGAHAYQIPISSIKGVTGNPLAATGLFQVIACALAVRDNIIPPTANLERCADGCDLDFVPQKARYGSVDVMMANMHGMGGENSSLIMKRA